MSSNALSRLLSPVKGYIIAGCLLAMLASAFGLAPYIAIAEIAVLIFKDPNISSQSVWLWVAIGIAGTFLRMVLLVFSTRLGHIADAEILHKIRVRIVRRLGTIPLGWFRAKGSGVIKKVMTTDLEEMHQLIAHSMREMIGAVTAIVVGIAYLSTVNWQMTLISIAVLLIMYVSFRIAMRSVTTHMNRLINAETKISTSAVEYADGITVVKTFGVGGRLLSRFDNAVKEYSNAFKVWVSETSYSSAISRMFASEVTLLGVLIITGLLFISRGMLAVADFLPFLIVGIGLPTTIVPAVHGSQGLRKGRLSASNIEGVLLQDVIPENYNPQQPQKYSVAFHNVSFAYSGNNDVIRDISFECPQGTVTALVGRSGSGKSTIAHLLPRFYDVRQGRITIGGIDIRQISSQKLLSSMSLVFQDIVLLRDTIRENIRIANPDARDEDIIQAARSACIHEVIEQLPQGYDTMLGTGNAGLSGGEQQRLTIARAMLSDAPIVVLDEATASLDPDNEVLVQRAMSSLVKNKTVIMIAHRLYTISNAHQIIVLQEGRIAEKGTHQHLLNNKSLYAKMWEAQSID
ncbi:MAG: ABC transporter ATP-binding protein [Chitinophagaceae bacterium]|nr:MAG: ABC transporter ATP-binding protein [Chitinophagaceae bacterium]